MHPKDVDRIATSADLIRLLWSALFVIMVVKFEQELSRNMTKQTKWLCIQQGLRSAWASAQSDQSLRCPLNG